MSSDFFQVAINSQRELCVVGTIDMTNVIAACAIGRSLIDTVSHVRINLSDLNFADSSCLAMLVDWLRCAKLQQKDIQFCNMPQFMLDLGRVCGLDAILPISKPLQFQN